MGGYGAYVWPSYLAAALAMTALVVVTMRSLRASERVLSELKKSRNDET